MLHNKWIITDKFYDAYTAGAYWYGIMPVDLNQGDVIETRNKYIWSKQDIGIGTYTDNELNPAWHRFGNLRFDTAVIEMASNRVSNTIIKQLAVFGRRFGEFNLLIDTSQAPFRIVRGDTILLRRGYTDFANGIPMFNILYNMTTRTKSPYFPKSKHDFGDCDKVVVVGIDSIDPIFDTQKHLLAYSTKFGYISFLFEEGTPEFATRENDRVLIEKYYDKNIGRDSYSILSNVNIDKMRTEFLIKRR